MRILLSMACGALALWPGPAAADVLRVSALGSVEHLDLQSAVDAAADGDVIVVGAGTYPGFTLTGKGVSIVAMPFHEVVIEGRVMIHSVPSSSTVLLSGIDVLGTFAYPELTTPPPLLEIAGCDGDVLIQDCRIEYVTLYDLCSRYLGVTAAEVRSSARVSFVGCELVGSRGSQGGGFTTCEGYAAGDGLRVRLGSAVALYGSNASGGVGGTGAIYGGDGGSGAVVEGSFLFASGCTFRGRNGGSAEDFLAFQAGAGGDGVSADASSEVVHLDSVFLAGNGGFCVCGTHGPAGSPQAGSGTFVALPGQQRFASSPGVAVGGDSMQWTVQGVAGDAVHLATSRSPGFQLWMPARGTWRVPFPPKLPVVPVAHLPSGAAVAVDLEVPFAGGGAGLLHLQALHIESSGDAILGPPRAVLVLDPAPVPPGLDCNSNGVLDLVDLVLGTSLDLDQNLLPDECNPVSPTGDWFVDAGATPGGDGSPGAPFMHMAQAFYWANHGDTVHVLPGTYVGVPNRDLDFGGRALHLVGVGGPSACILDAEGQGRFFASTQWIPGTLRIEGLTLRGGMAPTSEPSPLSGKGGAIGLQPGPERLVIDDCRFESCRTSSFSASGGAIAIIGGKVEMTRSLFFDCSSRAGGAIFGSALSTFWIHGTRFLQNRATGNNSGGSAMRLDDVDGVLLQDCVIAGNWAGETAASGALLITRNECSSATDLRILGCTVVGNHGSTTGRFLRISGRMAAQIRNTIVWQHQNGGESAIRVSAGGTSCPYEPSVLIFACNVEAGPSAVLLQAGSLDWGSWNLSTDPKFEDPAGPDGDPDTWLDNDLSLSLRSPCIDAGDNFSVPPDVLDLDGDGNTTEPAPFDLLGNPRIVDIPEVPDTGIGGPPTVDMGAYERQP